MRLRFLLYPIILVLIYIVADGFSVAAAQPAAPASPSRSAPLAPSDSLSVPLFSGDSLSDAGTRTPSAASVKTRPQFRYAVSFRTILDNLEDSWDYMPTRTIVGSTLTPMVGVQYGNHALIGGVFLATKYGSDKFLDKIDPRIYYQYKDARFMVAAGLFSRDLMKPSRLFHYTTSFKTFNNTLHGFLGQYTTETGYVEALVDWYLADASRRLDGVVFRVSGQKYFGGWFLDGQFSYHHRSDDVYFDGFKVYDQLTYDFRVGYEFGRLQSVFRSLYLTAGLVGMADQKRVDYHLQAGLGFETVLNLDWKGLYLSNTLYVGTPQMQYYKEYGSALYFGDPFYHSSFYDQIALGYVYKYKWVSVGAHVLMFFTDSPKIANQQLLSVAFDMDELVRPRPR